MSIGAELLTLATSGDALALRRAYATLLRQHRPDDDAQAFQQLQEAWQEAQAICAEVRQPDSGQHSDGGGDVGAAHGASTCGGQAEMSSTLAPTADEASAWQRLEAGDAETVVDIQTMACDLLGAATAGTDGLQEWLARHALQWPLAVRQVLGDYVLQLLDAQPAALDESSFAVLAAHFGWNDVHNGIDALFLRELQERCEQLWLLSTAGQATLRQRYGEACDGVSGLQPGMVARLQTPRSLWFNRWSALLPDRASDAVNVLAALGYWRSHRVPEGLDAGQVAFWERFAYPEHPVRLQLQMARSLLIGLILGAICSWGVISSWPLPPSADGLLSGGQKAAMIIAGGALLPLLVTAVVLGFLAILRWQVAHESHARGPAWLRWSFLPLAAIGTACLLLWVLQGGFSVFTSALLTRPLVFAFVFIALRRLIARGHRQPSSSDSLALWLPVLFPWIGVVAILVYWGRDLQAHRDSRHT